MKTFFKIVGGLVLVVLVLAAGALTWLSLKKPAQRPASSEKIDATPERLARGKYLANHVSDCFGCHSDHLESFSFPPKPGTEGRGGMTLAKVDGFPGVLTSRNITPDPETGIGNWTDGEILRALREGVDRHGKAIFPMMPYGEYQHMSDEDAKSIVAYLRTLTPIRYEVAEKKIDVPVNFIIKFLPKPLPGPVTAPSATDTLAHGKYLARIAGCLECHSPKDDKHRNIAGKEFSGGHEMKGPWGRNLTANITPHPDTFIGRATREEFIGRFRTTYPPVAVPKERNTVMPWTAFAGMTDEDLSAIYTYLKSVPAVENKVNSFPDAR